MSAPTAPSPERYPIELDRHVNDPVEFIRENPDEIFGPAGSARVSAVMLANDYEISVRSVHSDLEGTDVTKKKYVLQALAGLQLDGVWAIVQTPDDTTRSTGFRRLEIEAYPSAERLNAFKRDVLGLEPGRDVLGFANALVEDQGPDGRIMSTPYRQALCNLQYLRSTVPRSAYGLFDHDRDFNHNDFVLAQDPDTSFGLKLLSKTMTQDEFLSWFEDYSVYLGVLTRGILENKEVKRHKGLFFLNEFNYDEAALEALCLLYDYRNTARNRTKSLQRYSEHLANMRAKVVALEQAQSADTSAGEPALHL